VQDVVDRLPDLGSKGTYLKQMMEDKLIEHTHYIDEHGEDLQKFATGSGTNPNECTRANRHREDAGRRR